MWYPLPKRQRQRENQEELWLPSNERVDDVIVMSKSTLESKDGCASDFYEYLDHTADVQLHSWGVSMEQAFENIVSCMFNYITDLTLIEIDEHATISFSVNGTDLPSLLYNFMNEFLFLFASDEFVCKTAKISKFDREAFEIEVIGYGCMFDKRKHSQGTEIKAITYSNMQICEKNKIITDNATLEENNRTHVHDVDLYVIVDI